MGKRRSHKPRHPEQDEGEGAAHEGDEEKPKVALDGGTFNVARGGSATMKEIKQDRHQANQKLHATPGAIQHYTDEATSTRLARLEQDDQAPDMQRLNDKQKRALQVRRQRSNKTTLARLRRLDTRRMQAAVQAAQAMQVLETAETGLVQAEHEMERTTSLTQVQLKRDHLDAETARHIFQLDLSATAPYGMKYDRSGRFSILYGQGTGHLALMDNHKQCLQTEFHVHERVRDACFLHNYTMFAAAQKDRVYIYDNEGAEIHRLGDHSDPMALEFLPYHWLLASIGRTGNLRYRDTSTGEAVATYRTQLGSCRVLRQNPMNAVLHAGHGNGMVTLWSPATSRYLAKIHCHRGAAIHSLAIAPDGRTMVTGAADRTIRVWDLRMYRERHHYLSIPGIPSSLDISQTGILGVGHAGHATFWSAQALQTRVKEPYMHHAMPRCSPVETIRFRPFEDVCGIGHARGIDSIVIPGTGAAQLDTTEYHLNPAADAKQRQESEVRALLDKLQPHMITLDATAIGGIEESNPHAQAERTRDLQEEANAKGQPIKKKNKTKKRGQSKIATKLRRKRKNVIDQNMLKLKQAREEEKAAHQQEQEPSLEETAPAALKRFF